MKSFTFACVFALCINGCCSDAKDSQPSSVARHSQRLLHVAGDDGGIPAIDLDPFTADSAKALSPQQAKAILVARAAYEVRFKPYYSHLPVELRFVVKQTKEGGWAVGVIKYHYVGRHERPEMGMATVLLDDRWTVVSISPGA